MRRPQILTPLGWTAIALLLAIAFLGSLIIHRIVP